MTFKTRIRIRGEAFLQGSGELLEEDLVCIKYVGGDTAARLRALGEFVRRHRTAEIGSTLLDALL